MSEEIRLRKRVRDIGGLGLMYFGMPERSDNGLYKDHPDMYTSTWLTHNSHLPLMPEYSCASLHGCLLMLRAFGLIEIINLGVHWGAGYNCVVVDFWYTYQGSRALVEAMG